MARLRDIHVKPTNKVRPTITLTVDAQTGKLARKIARADHLRMTDFLDQALRAYVALRHPDWQVIEEDADPLAADWEAGNQAGGTLGAQRTGASAKATTKKSKAKRSKRR